MIKQYKIWMMPLLFFSLFMFSVKSSFTQAVVSLPAGIGLNCGAGNATDSFRVMNYNNSSAILNLQYKCFPNLGGGAPGGPSFSSSSGSVAFNPADQNIYYIATSNGNNSFVYHWRPDTCPTTKMVYSNYYNNQFVVGLDFTSIGDGYQLEFSATSPYTMFLRKVNFSTNTFGQADTLTLSSGKIYQENGDIIMTPLGQLYFCFDNKLYNVNYSTYGNAGKKDNATFIDTIKVTSAGDYVTGIAYAHGKFIASIQHGSSSPCYWKDIDISTGSAVLTNVTLPSNNYTATDMATIITGIGASKKVSHAGPLGGTSYGVQYDIKIRNFGNANLNNVQLVDSIKKVFGAAFVSATVAPVGTLPAGLTINPSYNGNTNNNIFVGGVNSKLNASPADSAIVRVSVTLNSPSLTATYNNTSIATATSVLFSQSVLDSTNNDPQLRADPNFNDVPDDIGENTPTPLSFNSWVALANKIVDFNATYSSKRVNTQWKLENIEGVITVHLQRSIDGINFKTIETFPDLNSDSPLSYSFTDYNPLIPNNYYRLEVVSAVGTTLYSERVLVSIPDDKPIELKVSPNPFYGILNFSLNLKSSTKIIYKLYDFNSRQVYSAERIGQVGENKLYIDNLNSIPPGTYLLQAIVNDEVLNKMVLKLPN